MERLLRPEKLSIDPDSKNAKIQWQHWYKTFLNFILSTNANESDKLKILINLLTPEVFLHINECTEYNDAVSILRNLYCKPINEVFARHKLSSRRQKQDETVDQFMESLKGLGKDCNFKAVTAETNRDDCIRDAFVNGLVSQHIRQRLLENLTLTLSEAYERAQCMESAERNSFSYKTSENVYALAEKSNIDMNAFDNECMPNLAATTQMRCHFCGYNKHSRFSCPARESICKGCGKKGHFIKVCRSSAIPNKSKSTSLSATTSAITKDCVATICSGLSKAVVNIRVNNVNATALIDTGSSASFLNDQLAKKLKVKINPSHIGDVTMATTSLCSKALGECTVSLQILEHRYENVTLSILPNLCAEIIIGHDLLSRHTRLEMKLGGEGTPLAICNLAAAKVAPASLFEYLTPDCHPISTKTRRLSQFDNQFIVSEVDSLLKEDVIEPSRSPWRAQALVTATENHKRRMVIDYSCTINRFTQLDAYPIPRIEELVNKVATYSVFSAIDLRSAYHQIPIRDEDKAYTAFEAGGRLYQFKRIPFGVTNGVAAFQRVIDDIIKCEGLQDTFAYLDDVTVCGHSQEEHDKNLKKFMEIISKYGLTLNKEKSNFSLHTINLLGYKITNNLIKPDPDRILPLRNFPLPNDVRGLRRAVGMFSHFSKYVPRFSEKIQPLTKSSFPLSKEATNAFNGIKKDIENAVLCPISHDEPFTVETDASNTAIAATLSQSSRPVAFFSRSLTAAEIRHSSVEKEAYAIIEAVRKWKHYLLGRHFRLITDQKSVSFMFNPKAVGKIKNEKIMRWRLELSCYNYDIVYRPGSENAVADSFTRTNLCSSITNKLDQLKDLHSILCHPGDTRFYHWVRSKNLPYTLEEVRKTTSSCQICAEVKPRFFKREGRLIKATSPFERLNIDFKGPLPSSSRNRYLLTIVDEYSRFPFAFPCPDMTAATIINKLKTLFFTFGMPAYIHTDRGTSFMSIELKNFLNYNGVATSRTTPYNPQGNGQVERYNGIIWKTVQLALRSKNIDITKWESVLDESLHSIRSLLCTSINCTPHERMFAHSRRSKNGSTTPGWLLTPGPVLLKRSVRDTKYDPLVKRVTLLEGNSEYAHVRLPDGHETTVSTRQLAPCGELEKAEDQEGFREEDEQAFSRIDDMAGLSNDDSYSTQHQLQQSAKPLQLPFSLPPQTQPSALPVRRSSRERRSPSYLVDYETS